MRSLDELADLTPVEIASRLVTADESQWFDRKSIRVQARDLAPALTGLANAEGGLLAIGVHDGVLEGVEAEPGRVNEIRQAAIDFTVPPVPMAARGFECARPDGSLTEVLLLEVRASDRVHATMRDEVYLRVGDETRLLGFDQRRELDFDKGQSTFETEPLRIMGPDALDEGLLTATADALGLADPARVLTALGLRDRDGTPSVGAALLFSQNPQAELPSAIVRVIRYHGTERGAGARQHMTADTTVGGPLTAQITAASQLVREHLPTRRALGRQGTFVNVGAVPEDAWLEGLVNAVTHRSYSHIGDHIRVEVFDDRVEISSPGRFPGVVDPTDPTSIARFARNPRIARVLKAHDFGQELGEGIRRMFEEMELAGLEEPVYRQTAGAVQLTLSARPVDLELERRLPDGARGLVRAIRDRGRASTGELVKSLGRSRPTLLRELNVLRDEGVVRWVGTSPKDPRAYWTLP